MNILPWVLFALDILRVVLVLISIKYRRINRTYIYLHYVYVAIAQTQPSIRSGSFNEYASNIVFFNLMSYVSFGFDFWCPMIIATIQTTYIVLGTDIFVYGESTTGAKIFAHIS